MGGSRLHVSVPRASAAPIVFSPSFFSHPCRFVVSVPDSSLAMQAIRDKHCSADCAMHRQARRAPQRWMDGWGMATVMGTWPATFFFTPPGGPSGRDLTSRHHRRRCEVVAASRCVHCSGCPLCARCPRPRRHDALDLQRRLAALRRSQQQQPGERKRPPPPGTSDSLAAAAAPPWYLHGNARQDP